MKKSSAFGVLLFSAVVVGFSYYGVFRNPYYVELLINLDTLFISSRIMVIAILLTYSFITSSRTQTAKTLLRISGVLLIALGVFSVISPTFMGYSGTYTLLGDSLFLIEAGILSLMLNAELSVKEPKSTTRKFHPKRPRVLVDPHRIVSPKLFDYSDRNIPEQTSA